MLIMVYDGCVIDRNPFPKDRTPLGYVPPLLEKVSSVAKGAGRNVTASKVDEALARGGTNTLWLIIRGLR